MPLLETPGHLQASLGQSLVGTTMRWLDGITDSMDMFEQSPGVGDGQGSLACYSPSGGKDSDMTE